MIPEWIPLIPYYSGIDTGIFHNPWNFAKPDLEVKSEDAESIFKTLNERYNHIQYNENYKKWK
jgi:hypothetical protein